MNGTQDVASPKVVAHTDGSGAAAVLAAGIACFALAVLALAADKSALLKSHLSLYKPTGPLSGVTTVAIVIWFLTWLLLELAWRNKTVAVDRICILALALLGLAMVLTFPPVVDLF